MAVIDPNTKTVLITGCSEGGLGSALCKAFLHVGCHVFVTVRDPAKAAYLYGDARCEILPLDVASRESIDTCVSQIRKRLNGKGLDVLVNNAGIGLTAPLLDTSIDEAKMLFDVNVWGLLAVTQAFASLLIEARGTILNISSIAGAVQMAWQGVYNSSKAAVTFLSETLRIELSPLGVHVVTAMVGEIETEFYGKGASFALPPGSHYKPAEAIIRKQGLGEMQTNNEKAEVTASNLVKDVLSGRTGKVWRGGVAGTVNPCGGCVDSGLDCVFGSTVPQRGPKKGHLKVLRSRIAALERKIGEQSGDDDCENVEPIPRQDDGEHNMKDQRELNDLDMGETSKSHDLLQSPLGVKDGVHSPVSSLSVSETDSMLGLQIDMPTVQLASGTMAGPDPYLMTPLSTPGVVVTPLMRADLDQLYFERVHTFMPTIQRRRYFARYRQNLGTISQSYACLQSSMWTLAAAMSSQFQHLCQPLYQETLQKLEHTAQCGGDGDAASRLELAQAWTFVSVYEFMHATFQRGWASAGRAIRMAQFLRLNSIDSMVVEMDSSSFVEIEEKRRTFWMVFCLDRFSCALKGLPLTLAEQTEYSAVAIEVDSMLSFTSSIAQIIILALYHTAEISSVTANASPGFIDDVLGYQWRARAAAKEIARLAEHVQHFSVFKVHPFTPIPLHFCRQLLLNLGQDGSLREDLMAVDRALEELKEVNKLCQDGPDLMIGIDMGLEGINSMPMPDSMDDMMNFFWMT
ncbi:putative Transcription factor domain-containing protein [Seiridium unicorne]|uniref:Transcription factor domain-containing protein n=1 Tax=Seiridium unicorne TaxID=138068 RepID=A0ABR2VC08_9PEZI